MYYLIQIFTRVCCTSPHDRSISCDDYIIIIASNCENMSGHALMGRPAARLETMALVFSSYAVVCIVCKKAMTFPIWVIFLNLCDDTPVFLTEIAY